MLDEEKFTEIERENRILLEKCKKIIKKKPQINEEISRSISTLR